MPTGRSTDFYYDALNRETGETWYADNDDAYSTDPSTATNLATFTYNLDSQALSAGDYNSDYAYTYYASGAGAAGQLESVLTDGSFHGTETPSVSLDYTYNSAGQISTLSANIGGTPDFINDYGYNSNNELYSLEQTGQTGGNVVDPKLVHFTYTSDAQFDTISRYADLAGDDLVATSTYGYDDLGRLSGIAYASGSTTYASYSWTYDPDNRVASFSDGNPNEDVSYGYSTAGRLISATPLDSGASSTASNTLNNSYDPDGNADPNNGWWTPWDSFPYGGSASSSGVVIGDGNRLLSDGTYNVSVPRSAHAVL